MKKHRFIIVRFRLSSEEIGEVADRICERSVMDGDI